jgi:hypothetical protein
MLTIAWRENPSPGAIVTKPRAASIDFRGPTRRSAERQQIAVPGRLTWRDSRGMTRFASVMARDVSASGAYLECRGGDAIPLYRLVYLQLERDVREAGTLPSPLREGRVLSAVFRVGPCDPSTGTPSGYALRFLVEPARARPDGGSTAGDTHQRERAGPYAGDDLSLSVSGSHLDGLERSRARDISGAGAASV